MIESFDEFLNWGHIKSFLHRRSSTINEVFLKDDQPWGIDCYHHPNSKRGSCFLFLLDKLDSIFEFEFFDKMRVGSLRLALNREEGTWLNHSRFLASLNTCIHESFAENYFYMSYM